MKMSDVFEGKVEIKHVVGDVFGLQDDASQILDASNEAEAAAHAVNCHDELVEALKLAFNGAEFLTKGEMEEIEEVLAKAAGDKS